MRGKSPISTKSGCSCGIIWTRLVELAGFSFTPIFASLLIASVASTKPLLRRASRVAANGSSKYIAQRIEVVVVKFQAHFSCTWKFGSVGAMKFVIIFDPPRPIASWRLWEHCEYKWRQRKFDLRLTIRISRGYQPPQKTVCGALTSGHWFVCLMQRWEDFHIKGSSHVKKNRKTKQTISALGDPPP